MKNIIIVCLAAAFTVAFGNNPQCQDLRDRCRAVKLTIDEQHQCMDRYSMCEETGIWIPYCEGGEKAEPQIKWPGSFGEKRKCQRRFQLCSQNIRSMEETEDCRIRFDACKLSSSYKWAPLCNSA
jgi:hypothetical protein